jgi:hypothetical protein
MTNVPTISPIEQAPIPQAKTFEELAARLKELMSGNIPGFILREAGIIYGGTEGAFGAVTKAVSEAHVPGTHELHDIYTMPFSSSVREDERSSDWHTDSVPQANSDEYGLHLHLTENGGADVALAQPGPRLSENYKRMADQDLLANLREGKTDTNLMEPKIYTGKVKKGDMVVFPTSGERPAWHSFKTDSEVDPTRDTTIKSIKVSRKQENATPDYSGMD